LRVAVSGRRGVGRDTVARALAFAGLAVMNPADADLDVYVLAEVVKPEDCAAVAAVDRPLLTVLNKADLIATTAPARQPNGPTAAARARCAQLSARAGIPVEPLIGLLAVASLDDTSWTALRALADGHTLDSVAHGRLMETLDVFGVRQATAAIRRGATRVEVEAVLRGLSGIDDVAAKIRALLHYRRMLEAVAGLETMAVTDERISDFLARDDTVVARMMAAMDAVEAVGMDVDRADTAAAHLHRATHWQRHRRGAARGVQRAYGTDIVRGSLRLWSKVGRPA
jgi:hypothetical protein